MLQNYQARDDLPNVKLAGLAPDLDYSVRVMGGGDRPSEVPESAPGSWWMAHGVPIILRRDFSGIGLILEAR